MEESFLRKTFKHFASAKSYKKRGEQIGYRGIGFKSVEGYCPKK